MYSVAPPERGRDDASATLPRRVGGRTQSVLAASGVAGSGAMSTPRWQEVWSAPQRRRAVAGLAIAVASAVAALGTPHLPLVRRLLEPLELTTLDWRVQFASEPQPERDSLTLVLLDTVSLRDWPYHSPVPRAVLATLVDSLSAAGARTIVLDVLLDRHHPESDLFGSGDAQLREAMRRAGDVVLAAKTAETNAGRILVRPHPYFAEVASAVGAADLPMPYETVRDGTLTISTRDGVIPGLALAAYAQVRGISLDSLLADARHRGALALPGLPSQYAQLPGAKGIQGVPLVFTGPPSRTDRDDGAFHAVDASTVLALGSALPAHLFRGRIALVGSGFHAEDQFRSPFYGHAYADGEIAGLTTGTEIHAAALQLLLSGRYPVPLGRVPTFALLLCLAALVAAATFRWGASRGATAATGLLGGAAVLATLLFAWNRIQLPLVSAGLAPWFSLLGSAAFLSFAEGREKRVIRGAFSRYVAPAVVDQLLADPSRLVLGGERREVTILFCDLMGFTALAERLAPERLVLLLNGYLDGMTRIILAEGGTLDKYIGDAVMAFFGAPTLQPDHALRACRAALRMQHKMQELNRGWSAEGISELRVRIGIATGTPVVGNIGGEDHFDYTVLGDAVNLAARLEPACKHYGVDILISEDTWAAAGGHIKARDVDTVALRGRTGETRILELIDLAQSPSSRNPSRYDEAARNPLSAAPAAETR